LLDDAARDYPNQTYTIFNDAPRTFAQVKDTADRIANFLHAKGIRKGDRVAIFLPNLPHYPAIYFGILKAGAVCVTCNPLYTPGELNYQLKDAGAKALFCMDHPQFYPTTEKAVQGTDVETVVVCNVKSYLPWLKGFLGGLLGKIPHAERHAPGHLDVRRCGGRCPTDPPGGGYRSFRRPGTDHLHRRHHRCAQRRGLTHSNFVYDLMALDAWARLEYEGRPGGRYPQGRPSLLPGCTALVSQLRHDLRHAVGLCLGQPPDLRAGSACRRPALYRSAQAGPEAPAHPDAGGADDFRGLYQSCPLGPIRPDLPDGLFFRGCTAAARRCANSSRRKPVRSFSRATG
jgi:hypothetical protein